MLGCALLIDTSNAWRADLYTFLNIDTDIKNYQKLDTGRKRRGRCLSRRQHHRPVTAQLACHERRRRSFHVRRRFVISEITAGEQTWEMAPQSLSHDCKADQIAAAPRRAGHETGGSTWAATEAATLPLAQRATYESCTQPHSTHARSPSLIEGSSRRARAWPPPAAPRSLS